MNPTQSQSQSSSRSRHLTPALVLGLLATSAAAFYGLRQTQSLQSSLTTLRTERASLQHQLASLKPDLDRAQADRDELERLRKQVEELHRLRGQYQAWQQQKAELMRLQTEVEQLRARLQQLAQNPAQRPAPVSWIGVAMGPHPGGGVTVQSVVPGSPAASAGLAPGDIITALDGRPVADQETFRSAIAAREPGSPVVLEFSRNGQHSRVSVSTAPFPR